MDARKTAKPRSLGPAKVGAPAPRRQEPSLHPPTEGGNEQWAMDPSDVRRHARLKRERERVSPLGKLVRYAVVVLLLVGAGAAYWNFDTLRGTSVSFSGLVDLFAKRVNDTVAKFDGSATQTEVVKETEVVGTAAPSSLPSEPQAAAPEPVAVTATDVKAVATAAPPEASAPREAPPPPPAAPEPPPGPEQFSFGLEKIEVSEGAASADILIVRSGDMRRASSVTWWTSDGTATAGEDYANLGRVVVKFAPSEQNRGIHIPIIGDKKVEGPENFFVNLAPGNAQPGEATERLEVVIKDDD